MNKIAKLHTAPPKHGDCAPFALMLLFPKLEVDWTKPRSYSLGSIAVNLGIENEVFSLSLTPRETRAYQDKVAPNKAILMYLDCLVQSEKKQLIPHFAALIITSDSLVLVDARLGYSMQVTHSELAQHCIVQRAAVSTKDGKIILYDKEHFAHILIDI
jgi:hypothetical protein